MSADELRKQRDEATFELSACVARQPSLASAVWYAEAAENANDARIAELTETLRDLDTRIARLDADDREPERGVAGVYYRAKVGA